jgi:hypothetical protein
MILTSHPQQGYILPYITMEGMPRKQVWMVDSGW